MELLFRTKEEANKQQQEDFLSLTPVQRFYAFLTLSERIARFPTRKRESKVGNSLVINIETHGKNLTQI